MWPVVIFRHCGDTNLVIIAVPIIGKAAGDTLCPPGLVLLQAICPLTVTGQECIMTTRNYKKSIKLYAIILTEQGLRNQALHIMSLVLLTVWSILAQTVHVAVVVSRATA